MFLNPTQFKLIKLFLSPFFVRPKVFFCLEYSSMLNVVMIQANRFQVVEFKRKFRMKLNLFDVMNVELDGLAFALCLSGVYCDSPLPLALLAFVVVSIKRKKSELLPAYGTIESFLRGFIFKSSMMEFAHWFCLPT